jgi:hypothetical protein
VRKSQRFSKTAIAIAVSTIFLLSACAGGGGGGGGTNNPGNSAPPTQGTGPPTPDPTPTPVTNPVPYATPVRVGSVTPINSTTYEYDSSTIYAENLTNNGESLITVGRSGTTLGGSYPTYNLNVFDWENGQLVNKTSRWFSGNDNKILGADVAKFADFNGDGKLDMYVASSTDYQDLTGSSWVFFNNGSSFTRLDLNLGVHGNDSAVYDINGDGRTDIYTSGGRVSFGNTNNTFTTYSVTGQDYGGSAASVAIADFMGNGSSSIILTDQNAWQSGNNKLYSWALTDASINGRTGLEFTLSKISTLPDSRFLLPKWSSYGFTGSHDYRALAFDFDNSGLASAVIFSRPVKSDGVGGYTWPEFNEIQFLKNRGGGTFIDVTDTTLVGYNTASSSSHYNPKIMDVNNDGLLDIVLTGTSWTSTTTGAQVLIHTKEHKYVSSYAAVIDAFVGQSLALEKAINTSATSGANGIVFVKGPDGSMYLATAISYSGNGAQQKAIYLSKLGTTTASAQATVNSIKQVWPWMSDAQVNTVLAASSTNYFGFNLLDTSKVFQPVGDVSIPLSGGRGFSPIRGYVMGIGLDDSDTLVTDSVGRGFTTSLKFMNVSGMNRFGYSTEHNDQHNLTSHAEYLVNGTPVTYGNMRVATETRYGINGTGQGASATTQNPTQYSVGIPQVYKKGKFSYGAQYTSLNTNPWIAFGGAWGSITSSGIFDNVVTYRDGGFSTQASLMHVTTNITPGLITKVNNIVGTWAESGYRFGDVKDKGDIGVYAGIKPVVLSGDVEAKMPTSIDNNGNVVYTNKRLAIQNQVTPYVRALYTNMIDKKTMYRFSVMGTQQGQYRLMHELRWWLD